jgi:hypothetical protein
MFSIEHKGNMVHNGSSTQNWAASLRTEGSKAAPVSKPAGKDIWVGAVSKPETTPFRHTKRLSISETTSNTPKSTVVHESPIGVQGRRDNELRPVDWVGTDEKFSWERTLRSSTQPKPVVRRQSEGNADDKPWRNGSKSAPVSASHTREPSMATASRAASRAHSRAASNADPEAAAAGGHSRKASSIAAGGHSRKVSMAHSRRSTRNSIKFDGELAQDELLNEPIDEAEAEADAPEVPEPEAEVEEVATRDFELPAGEPEVAPEPTQLQPLRTAAVEDDGPQAVKETLAGSMLVEQAELIASMTVKQVVEQLATGTTVFKAWVRGQKQRGSTRHVKARVANDLVLLQYPSGFSKRQMTVIVSSIYVTVEPTKTVLTLETDNGTLVLKPYTPEHATLWAFGFNALLHLADKQGMMDENTVISDLPWHGIFQSQKDGLDEVAAEGEAVDAPAPAAIEA